MYILICIYVKHKTFVNLIYKCLLNERSCINKLKNILPNIILPFFLICSFVMAVDYFQTKYPVSMVVFDMTIDHTFKINNATLYI